jgi:hypothetical protein
VLALLAAPALAQDKNTRVPVQAEVVLASTTAGTVDSTLLPMQETLATRVKYQSMKKVSSVKLQLSSAPSSVALPNQKTAEVSLVSLKDNVAQVKVKVPPVDATYSLGKQKSLYVQAGPHEGGDLWLVLSQPK